MVTNSRRFFDRWHANTSFIALLLYIAYAGTRRLNLPIEITYSLLALAVLFFFLVLYLLFHAIRYKPMAGMPQKTYAFLGFRLLISIVLLYLVAAEIWAL